MSINIPVDPVKQSTPAIELDRNNIANFGSQSENIQSVSTNNSQTNNGIQTSGQQIDPSSFINYVIEIAPADVATVDPKAFLTAAPLVPIDVATSVSLPQGFDITLSPESLGKYGSVITDSNGQQSVTVNVNIPDVDGIISYEVRLIKNA